jgi:glycosyltransferase involved in cell wall biosynthesis
MEKPDKKKLVIIEAVMSPGTPSAKSVCGALPLVLDAGWEVEIWSSGMTLKDPRLIWKRVPSFTRLSHLQFWFFSAWVTARFFWRRLRGTLPPSTLVQSVGPYLLWANLPAIHFVSVEYLRQMKAFRGKLEPSLHHRLAHLAVSVLERIWWRIDVGRRVWLVVSERLCEDLQRHVRPKDLFMILPNSYDSSRFSPQVRREWRQPSRDRLGIGSGEAIFAFVCLGSFERKGLPLALQACSLLNASGTPCRLLVVGGPNQHPPDLAGLAAKCGVTDLSFVIAHGRDPRIEQLLSAADALLFPSYSEAFSLVEIEAAALGLRLYLTPHYGSEMILRDGENGRLLPWDPAGMAKILEADIRSGDLAKGCTSAHRAVTEEAFGPVYLDVLDRAHRWITRNPESGTAAVTPPESPPASPTTHAL